MQYGRALLVSAISKTALGSPCIIPSETVRAHAVSPTQHLRVDIFQRACFQSVWPRYQSRVRLSSAALFKHTHRIAGTQTRPLQSRHVNTPTAQCACKHAQQQKWARHTMHRLLSPHWAASMYVYFWHSYIHQKKMSELTVTRLRWLPMLRTYVRMN